MKFFCLFLLSFWCGVVHLNPTNSPLRSAQEYLDVYKYEQIVSTTAMPTTTTTAPTTTSKPEIKTTTQASTTMKSETEQSEADNETQESSQSLIYTLQKDSSRDSKMAHRFKHPHHHQHEVQVFDYKCPKQHQIHPCDCLELDKRLEMMEENGEESVEGSGGDSGDLPANATLMIEDTEPHPDMIETVAFCKNIRNVQVLTEAVRGFQGHRLNYFVLDGCKLPPFPNNLFHGIHIVWMEVLNSTMQFHDNFWTSNCKTCS